MPQRIAVLLLAITLPVLAFAETPAAPPVPVVSPATPQQIDDLTSRTDQVKALIQAGNLKEATKQTQNLIMDLYKLTVVMLTPEQRLRQLEDAMANAKLPRFRMGYLPVAAHVALDLGQLDKAEAYSRDLLSIAEQDGKQSSMYASNVHIGNILLGRVALQRNHDVAAAKASLLAAARIPTNSMMQHSGPNTALARDLLAAGERGAVLEYLSLSRVFWTEGQERLDRWTSLIQAGAIPDFGANSVYYY